MNYIFFYSSIIVLIIGFIICCKIRALRLSNVIIGITTVGYSLINDTLFGNHFHLFYYISLNETNLFMILAALFLYPILNMIYTMFLPVKSKNISIYTICWIVLLLVFEYFSLKTRSLIFTGWQPIPWSIVSYIVAYLWIFYFYRYLTKKVC